MRVLLLHVHGVGGKDYKEGFITKTKQFLKIKNLENKVSTMTYQWESVNIRLLQSVKDWESAKENALNEFSRFKAVLENYDKSYDTIYITAFSLGTMLVANYLEKIAEIPASLKFVFFLGAAMDSRFHFTKKLPFKILNYYSDKADKVLKIPYSLVSSGKAGGQYGFNDINNFINFPTNIEHKNYNNIIPQIVLSFIIYWENSFDLGYKKFEFNKKSKRIKISHKSLNKIIQWKNLVIYQKIPLIGEPSYLLCDLSEDNSTAFVIPKSTNDLINLLKHIGLTYEEFTKEKLNSPLSTEDSSKVGRPESGELIDLKISNVYDSKKSFRVKLIYKIPVAIDSEISVEFFKRFEKIDTSSYLSNLNILVNDSFRKLTDNTFIWADSKKGSLPLVYRFDFSFFKGMKKIFLKVPELGDKAVKLKDIDLIPVKKSYSYLSFTLEGSACSVTEYLKFIKRQSYGKIPLQEIGNKEFDAKGVTLSGLTEYIIHNLKSEQALDDRPLKVKNSGERPFIMQYLLLSSRLDEISAVLLENLLKTTGSFAKSYSNSNYSPVIWQNEIDSDVVYASMNQLGLTAISTDYFDFYRNNMPVIFMQANYMQYIILEELQNKSQINDLANCFQDKIRQDTFINLAESLLK